MQFIKPDKILLSRRKIEKRKSRKQDLQSLLRESRSFRDYMLNKPLDKLEELIK